MEITSIIQTRTITFQIYIYIKKLQNLSDGTFYICKPKKKNAKSVKVQSALTGWFNNIKSQVDKIHCSSKTQNRKDDQVIKNID